MVDLDLRFTFDNFVVGPANRLASAAARRAAEAPGTSYNPLFIYSASGLGKTHILGAIAHHVGKIHPDKRVLYQTLEGFLEELTDALEEGDRDSLRGRYSGSEILLVDDVQFLTGQPEAQEMLLRTLDALTGKGKQVVLASDRPPAEINGLDARLRSRFEAGLLVDIGPPEYETRVAIVRRRAEARGQELAPGVAEAVGRISYRNVRELGGALNRILAIQELEERTVLPGEIASLLGEEATRPAAPGELDSFLAEISDTVAAQVEVQEAPWRKLLREAAREAEAESFRADRLRRHLDGDQPPDDVEGVVAGFRETLRRLRAIREELDAVGNPWPEAAHGLLKDPERLEEAEALLASARERARPLPPCPPGSLLGELEGCIPQLVLRAAEQLIRTDRPEYNPLFVWSPEGDGARALLEAAGRSYQREHEGARVAFVSVAQFAEDFIGALSGGVAGAWRERWWSAELLLVHGAEALAETERAQEEFFHLFEALQRRRARIMVAADRPPAGMEGIDDRLRSRFEGGLVLEVEVRGSTLLAEEPSFSAPGEAVLPPLEEILARDAGRGGLFVAPPGGGEEDREGTPGARRGAREVAAPGRKEELSALDREWIMAFQPPAGMGRDQTTGEESAEIPMGEAWLPSPERVVWKWPRIEDRVVEEAG